MDPERELSSDGSLQNDSTILAVVQPNHDRSRFGGRSLWGARSGVSWRESGARCGGGYPEMFIANRRASDSDVCRIHEHQAYS